MAAPAPGNESAGARAHRPGGLLPASTLNFRQITRVEPTRMRRPARDSPASIRVANPFRILRAAMMTASFPVLQADETRRHLVAQGKEAGDLGARSAVGALARPPYFPSAGRFLVDHFDQLPGDRPHPPPMPEPTITPVSQSTRSSSASGTVKPASVFRRLHQTEP